MKNVLLVLVALLLAAPLAAQVVPSAYVPLAGNCALYDGEVDAGAAAYLPIRGLCGVPDEANAVAVVVEVVEPCASGQLSLFDSGMLASTAKPLLDFRRKPGSSSTWAVVRLCYPALECSGVDLGLTLSAKARAVVRAAGYFQPLP